MRLRAYPGGVASLGVHFAVGDEVARRLAGVDGDDELEALVEEIEEDSLDVEHFDTDKAWDAIHRSLTDGQLEYDNGEYPLNAVILGGDQLHKGDDYVVGLLPPAQVREVADALADVDRDRLRAGYDQIDAGDYDNDVGDEDFDYTWAGFDGLPAFFRRAADAGLTVIFTVAV